MVIYMSITSKLKTMKAATKAKIATASLMAGTMMTQVAAYCDVDGNSTMQNFLKTLFNFLLFGGIILAIVGIILLIKTIVSIASGEQAQPGAIGKGLGMLIGGVVLACAKLIVTGIIGQDPTTMTFM